MVWRCVVSFFSMTQKLAEARAMSFNKNIVFAPIEWSYRVPVIRYRIAHVVGFHIALLSEAKASAEALRF